MKIKRTKKNQKKQVKKEKAGKFKKTIQKHD
jgi:hypothetical protein